MHDAEGAHRIVEDKPIGRAGALTVLNRQKLSVLRLYDRGFSTDEIARRLGVSTDSVSTYLRRAGQKLGASGRVEILRKGKAYDLL
ncbi:Bacterial regulatory protein luxR family [Bifidobacterium italicum]|uniref:Bacterial regulatory protein luxR family n=1 Tax=Bifidobacterium italicum TaxID=1960968 RepID=A0A2A2ELX9_9BIFI|nr:helix-turn-helix transcriptional regulator [Bifidobacterium italicum]PAU69930.1 Bacterial regulatory protein luxR family [Bifidobacterium italicum]